MSRILVTGCSGFLAGHLLQGLLAEEGSRIFGVTEVPGFAHAGVEVFQVDIRSRGELERVVRDVRPDLTFHLAAVTNVGFAWKNPELTYEVNFLGSSNLLEALRQSAPGSRLLLMSSAEVYRPDAGPLLAESSPLAPQNPYALSKAAMEMLAGLYGRVYAIQACIARAFNFTGPGQDAKFVASDFARQVAGIERGEREAVLRVGNLAAVRDFSDVRDVARWLRVIAAGAEPGEVFNLCSGAACSIRELLDRLLAQARVPIRVEVDPDRFRPLDNPVLRGDPGRMRRRFGLAPEYPLERTLLDLLDFWRGKAGEDPGH